MESNEDTTANYLARLIKARIKEQIADVSSQYDDDTGKTVSPSINFQEIGSVQRSFISLMHRIIELLQKENALNLKLTCKKIVTDAQLPKYFCSKIQSCGNDMSDLLSALTLSPYWNWIDIRLMENVAAISSIEARNLIKQYKEYLYPQRLVDLLSLIPAVGEVDESNFKMMSVKIGTDIDAVTIEDFLSCRHILETKLLNLKGGSCILKHVKKESFEIDWLIPNEQGLSSYESAKRNCKKFHEISLLFVHIQSYEPVYQVTSSPRTALEEMTNYEQLRAEINNLKADITQLRTNNDNQSQQVYSLNNEYATLKDEIELLKVKNNMLKVENVQLKQQLIPTSPDDLYSGLMNIKWKEGTPAPLRRADHTAAWLNGLVYVGGGNESGYTNSYKIDCYDPVKDSWSSPINTPYRHFAIVTLNNKLLAVGGMDKGYKTTNHILIMDDDHLKDYTKMFAARSWAAAVGYQGMLIIAGGLCNENILTSTECFDSKNKQWYICDALPQPSYCLQSAIVDGILYLSGGATESGDSLAVFMSPLETLSKPQLKWKSCQDIPCHAPALVSIDGTYLLIVGGVEWNEIHMHTHTLDVHRLNKDDHSWEAIGHIPSARKSPAAVCTADNRIVVIGGWNDKGEYTNTVWIGSCAPQ